MRGKGEFEEQENTNGWLTTYSDMVTLLMTFFVLLFAISNVDAQKFALLAAGLSRDGITAEQFLDIQEKYNLHGVDMPDPNNIQYPAPDDKKEEDPNAADEAGLTELGRLHELIVEYIQRNNLQDSLDVAFSGDKVLLTLSNDIWFESGSSVISDEMRAKGAALAVLLRDTNSEDSPFDVISVGHTDNVPINTARYPSNWYLSVDRAVNFLDLLIRESGLNTNVFSARGCGEEWPIDDNNTPEGRQKNRRVEVLISQPKEQR